MKCNHFKEYPDCSFFYNGLCLRDHIYECPPLMNMKNLSNGEMVQIAEGKKNKTPRYIDANRLIDLAMHEGAYGYVDVHDIYNTPTADVVERKTGTWINDDGLYRCSSCNMLWAHWWASAMPPERLYKEMKYCPHCGAEMREEKTNEKD